MKTILKEIEFLKNKKLVDYHKVFDGAIIQVYQAMVKLNSGKVVSRDIVHHLPAVAILAITEDDCVVLAKQFRPAISQEILEIPAGLIDIIGEELEEPLVAAKRELEEETNFVAKTWTSLGAYYLSPGVTDEKIHLFKAQGLTIKENAKALDDDEELTTKVYTKDEIRTLIMKGLILDMKTILALEYWLKE